MTEEEARATLAVELPRSRKRKRLALALGIGSAMGFVTALILSLAHLLPDKTVIAWQAINLLIRLLTLRYGAPSARQREALATVLAHAQQQDLPMLIEGLEYLDQERFDLITRVQALLPNANVAQLPEGAQSILRQHARQETAPLEFRLAIVRALLRHPTPQNQRFLQKLGQTPAKVPGEEALIALIRQEPLVQPPLPSAQEARALLDQHARFQDRLQRGATVGKWALFLGFFASLALALVSSQPYFFFAWLIAVGSAAIGTIIFGFRSELPRYTRQAAYLRLVEEAHPDDLPRLQRHFTCLRTHSHQHQAKKTIERLGGTLP